MQSTFFYILAKTVVLFSKKIDDLQVQENNNCFMNKQLKFCKFLRFFQFRQTLMFSAWTCINFFLDQ